MTHQKLILGMVVVLTTVAVLMTVFAAVSNAERPLRKQTPTPSSRRSEDWKEPAYKQAFEATVAAQEAKAKKRYEVSPLPKLKPLTSCPDDTAVKVGVFDFNGVGVLPGRNYQTNYAVTTSSDGSKYMIVAGAPGDAPEKGLLTIIHYIKDPCAAFYAGQDIHSSTKAYVTSKGPLRLIRIEGERIVYSGPNGLTGHFGFVNGQFSP